MKTPPHFIQTGPDGTMFRVRKRAGAGSLTIWFKADRCFGWPVTVVRLAFLSRTREEAAALFLASHKVGVGEAF